jgi:hypothetical protein
MSLVKCAECTTEISDRAKACPKCGAPQNSPIAVGTTRKGGRGLSWFVGIAGLVVVFLVIVSGLNNAPSVPRIKAAINYLDSQVVIANGEPVALQKCMLTIEANGSYYLQGVDVPVKGLEIRDGEMFTNLDSERFNPHKYAPRSISIECDTANGKRGGTRDFR